MKGKNKLILVLFAVMALVATSVGFALKQTVDTIRYANAESIPGFTAKLEGDVIFSAERVLFGQMMVMVCLRKVKFLAGEIAIMMEL